MPSRKYRSSRRVRKSPKKSYSRSRSVSAGRRRCNAILSAKVKKNIGEYGRGRYANRAQAIAVAYSQVRKSHPKCKRYYKKRV